MSLLRLFNLLLLLCLLLFSGGKAVAQPMKQEILLLDSLYHGPHKVDRSAIDRVHQQARAAENVNLQTLAELFECDYLILAQKDPDHVLERRILRQLQRMQGRKEPMLKAFGLKIASSYYWFYGQYSRSFEYGLGAYNIYTTLSWDQFPFKHQSLYDLAIRFYHFRDYRTAKKYLVEARDAGMQLIEPSHFNVLNALGLCYRNLGQYDSAAYYFIEARRIVTARNKIAWIGITSGNLGITYYLQGRYDEAIPLLITDTSISLVDKRAMDNGAKSLAILGDIYFIQGRTDDALRCLQRAYTIMEQEGFLDAHAFMLEIYPRLARVWAAKGNMDLAYRYSRLASFTKDSISNETNALILAGAQHKADAEKHSADMQLLRQQRQMQTYIRNGLLVGIVLICVIALLIINRQQLRHHYRHSRLTLKQEQAQKELQEAERQLAVFTKAIHEKNNVIERFEQELRQSGAQPDDLPPQHEVVTQLQQLTILTDDEWDNFRILFEKVHSGFLYRLKENIPGLSPAEVRFIALLKLKFSHKEMAGILGITPNAVRTLRSRLRKKLDLQEDASVEARIERI